MSEKEKPLISRREFIAGAGLLGIAYVAGSVASKIYHGERIDLPVPEIMPQVNTEVKNGKIELGEEKEIRIDGLGVSWTPDGHIPYVTFPDGKRKFFVSGNAKCYAIDSSEPVEIETAIGKAQGKAKLAIGPDSNPFYTNHRGEVHYRNGYTAITTVLQTDKKDPYHLVGFTHNEEWMAQGNGHNFTASISLVESKDGGETWSEKFLLGGDQPDGPGGERVQGVGQPHAIIKDNEVYMYYIDWMGYKREQPDQLYLAKMKINEDGTLGEMEHFTTDGFNKEYNPAKLKSVIPAPKHLPKGNWAALPSMSFNKFLNQYLCVFETNKGVFCKVTSKDGLNWSSAEVIYDTEGTDVWNSYPTLLSDQSESSDQTTGETGNLYYSKSELGLAHNLVKRPYKIV